MKYHIEILIDANKAAINAWLESRPNITLVSLERRTIKNPIESGLRGHKKSWIETVIIYTEDK